MQYEFLGVTRVKFEDRSLHPTSMMKCIPFAKLNSMNNSDKCFVLNIVRSCTAQKKLAIFRFLRISQAIQVDEKCPSNDNRR